MATPIPIYNSFADIIAAVEANFPDNNTRLITPLQLRATVLGITQYIISYMLYKPEVITFTNQSQVVIPMTADRITQLGYVPAPYVFFGDDTAGWQYTPVPWSIDKQPTGTTTITVEVGGPDSGIIILK